MSGEEDGDGLFETRKAKGRVAYKVFACTIFVGICLIWLYRLIHIPRIGGGGEKGITTRFWAWIGMFMAELWFGLYWILTQSQRWNNTYRHPFKNKLLHRYGDNLPSVDIFVCTADASIEPPTLVVNTVLSVMSYNYRPEKLSVYLSDDGCSELTFYALLEASGFAKHWIPFCKKFMVEPRCPEAYFAQQSNSKEIENYQEWLATKGLYEEMKSRIEAAIETGIISKELRQEHKGFLEWTPDVTKSNHQSIVQIIINGKDENSVDNSGCRLPTLVCIAREKRPQWPHNFKAGSMNAVIRVSSEISNAPIILNLDCDMYANYSDIIHEALCFFMDEEKGHEVSYVQVPLFFNNITKNDLYSSSIRVANKVELAGFDGYHAAMYCGTGCFHRRESLCGKKYSKDYKGKFNFEVDQNIAERTVAELEEAAKVVANCSYEKGTLWGKEMGLVYGCPVEDVITGLTMQCKGWKPIYYYPRRKAFLGVAPTTLEVALVQHKRWSEGMFQIFLSRYCPFFYGHGKMELGGQMAYCAYLLWAPTSLPTLYYVIVPSLCFLHGISLFPQVSSMWFIPFAYVFIAKNAYSIVEDIKCGNTLKAWWILQQIWVFRRTSSHFLAFINTIIKQLGLGQMAFAITAKVVTDDVSKRYQQEVWEFGSSCLMFTILATLAMVNLFTLIGGILKKAVLGLEFWNNIEDLIPQIILCGLVVAINAPVYQALFTRTDKGSMSSSVLVKSIVLASLACVLLLVC